MSKFQVLESSKEFLQDQSVRKEADDYTIPHGEEKSLSVPLSKRSLCPPPESDEKQMRDVTTPLTYPVTIAMTANVAASDRQLCKQAGMQSVITKPINFEYFHKEIYYWARCIQNHKKKN